MVYLDVYVVSAGLIATIVLIVDLRALRAALERERLPLQTSREPAVARSQRPPAPSFDPKDSAASTGGRDDEIAPAAVR